jgi:hypothetical protein
MRGLDRFEYSLESHLQPDTLTRAHFGQDQEPAPDAQIEKLKIVCATSEQFPPRVDTANSMPGVHLNKVGHSRIRNLRLEADSLWRVLAHHCGNWRKLLWS